MKLSNMARKESTVGEMINIISVDIQSLNEFCHYVHMTWSSVVFILIGTYLLWQQLGVAALASLFAMIVTIPFNSYLFNKAKTFQIKKLKQTDSRVKMINEMLNGIKVIKLYAWELPFKKLITDARNAELKLLKSVFSLKSWSNFTWILTPFLVIYLLILKFRFRKILMDYKNKAVPKRKIL